MAVAVAVAVVVVVVVATMMAMVGSITGNPGCIMYIYGLCWFFFSLSGGVSFFRANWGCISHCLHHRGRFIFIFFFFSSSYSRGSFFFFFSFFLHDGGFIWVPRFFGSRIYVRMNVLV